MSTDDWVARRRDDAVAGVEGEGIVAEYERAAMRAVWNDLLLGQPEPWPCPCAACRQRDGKPARLSRMRAQYRRKQRGWR